MSLMSNINQQGLYRAISRSIIIQLTYCFQGKKVKLNAINCFILLIRISILFTYKDVFKSQGGTSRDHFNHHLVNSDKYLKTRLDAVSRKCSHSLQREPRNIVRDKDYPSSATEEIPSPLLIHRFNLNVELEEYV